MAGPGSKTSSRAPLPTKRSSAKPAAHSLVFGYGSLVNRDNLKKYFASLGIDVRQAKAVDLHGFRRNWSVAMDNRDTIPGYKYYVDEASGERPDAYVCFLNISAASGTTTNGLAFEVPPDILPELDKRERNYDRIDVSPFISGAPDGYTVWAYVANKAGEKRYLQGQAEQKLLIDAHYKDDVEKAFQSFGESEYQRFLTSTDFPPVPVRKLCRINLPDSIEV